MKWKKEAEDLVMSKLSKNGAKATEGGGGGERFQSVKICLITRPQQQRVEEFTSPRSLAPTNN